MPIVGVVGHTYAISAFTALSTKDQVGASGQAVGLGASRDRCGNGRGRVRRRGHTRVLGLGVQVAALGDGHGRRGRRRAGERAKLDVGGGARGRRGLLDVDGGLAAVVAVGSAAHDGGHGWDGGRDAAAVHRGHGAALAMLSALRGSHCRGRAARRDRRRRDLLGRVGVRAAGSGLSRSSGHVGGRSRRGVVRGRSGRGSGDWWVLRVGCGCTHEYRGRRGWRW